ncbi:MAG TPA: tol-pal system-associated acyl-CoA thioesterase [Steroidobacteraceae bacterium]
MAPFTIPVRVYWEDTDAGGVVYHASYLRFLERARTDWLRAIGVDQSVLLRDQRRQFAVVEANIRYHRPARFDDRLLVSVRLEERRGASIVMQQEIRRDAAGNELLISATVRAACLDSDSLRPRPLPAALVTQL